MDIQEMEQHVHNLMVHCRLCGEAGCPDTQTRKPISKHLFRKEILQGLNQDVEQDTDIHPPSICQPCRMKLTRYKASRKKYKTAKEIQITTVTFEPHSVSCKICQTHRELLNESVSQAAIKSNIIATHSSTGEMVMLRMNAPADRVAMHITIQMDGNWTANIHGRQIRPPSLPTLLTTKNMASAAEALSSWVICTGNNDFLETVKAKVGQGPATLYGKLGQVIADQDEYGARPTIRHINCKLIVGKDGDRCSVCTLYRPYLYCMKKRQESVQSLSPTQLLSSRTRNDRLPGTSEMDKLKAMTALTKNLKRKVHRLEEKIYEYIQDRGELLPSELNTDFTTIMEQHESEVASTFDTNSPQRLLWEQQKLMATRKTPNGMRWHPAMLRWCIALHGRSPAAYKMIRGSKFLTLPHENTLRDYTLFTTPTSGINKALLLRIKQDIGFADLAEFQKDVSLVLDGMKIRSGLVYSSSEGRLVGFCDLSDTVASINTFVYRLQDNTSGIGTSAADMKLEPATHVLALMIRGIFSPLKAVFAFYPCLGFTSYQLYPVVWKAISYLESAGFRVRSVVSDGASPNRKFYRLHTLPDWEGVVYYTRNRWRKSRGVFFICDAPHLMKTTRNNWENSKWNKQTRHLHYNKQDITWPQLMKLVEEDVGIGTGLRRLPRLQHEHLYLKPSLRMKVKLAAQVLSSSVASAFRVSNVPGIDSTVHFVKMMDRFFDCLNVSRLRGAKKPELKPYTSPHDWRFKWLTEEFLGFLNDWEKQCMEIPDMPMSEKRKLCISRETLEGLRITVKSFTTLGQQLLRETDGRFLLSDKFNQDPLEEHFSLQRGLGGKNDNPTAGQFARNVVTLQVIGSKSVVSTARGNCTIRGALDTSIDNSPLPKRQK